MAYSGSWQLRQITPHLFAFFWWDSASTLSLRASRSARHSDFMSDRVAAVLGSCTDVPCSSSCCTTNESTAL